MSSCIHMYISQHILYCTNAMYSYVYFNIWYTCLHILDNYSSELVCTAGVVHLGFKRTGTYDISRWLKQHPRVTTKTASLFVNSAGNLEFGKSFLRPNTSLVNLLEELTVTSARSHNTWANYLSQQWSCFRPRNMTLGMSNVAQEVKYSS